MKITISRRATAMLATGLLAVGGVLYATPASAEADVSLGITGGTLTASFADVNFLPVNYAFAAQNTTQSATLTVSDMRGSGAGWNVTVTSSNLVSGGDQINDENLSFSTLATPSMVQGQARHVTGGPNSVPGSVGDPLDAAVKVITADSTYGQGEYTQANVLQVAIPALQKAGTYTGTLTVSATSGP